MATLAGFASEIAETCDQARNLSPRHKERASWNLRLTSLQIRRIAWNYRCRAEARSLADLADKGASRLAEEAGQMCGSRLPLWG
jgi:hypothetical protein